MDTLAPTILGLFLGAAGVTVLDLYKRDMGGVLGAVGFFLLGIVLGGLLQVLVPAGVLFGALGGASLGIRHFGQVRRSRVQAIEQELEATEELAERMVLAHNRMERLQPSPKSITRFLGMVGVALATLLACLLLLTGFFLGEWDRFLVGGIAAGLPAAVWASQKLRAEEFKHVSRILTAYEDEAAGVLPEMRPGRPQEGER